jgi:hypothetical protein
VPFTPCALAIGVKVDKSTRFRFAVGIKINAPAYPLVNTVDSATVTDRGKPVVGMKAACVAALVPHSAGNTCTTPNVVVQPLPPLLPLPEFLASAADKLTVKTESTVKLAAIKLDNFM